MKVNRKTKILIISVLILITMTSGIVVATTDIGGKLQRWYDAKFKGATEEIYGQIFSGLEDDLNLKFREHGTELVDLVGQKINEIKDWILIKSPGEIYIRYKDYDEELNKAEKTLKDELESDFQGFVLELNENTNLIIEQEINRFLEDLDRDLDKKVEDMSNRIMENSSNAQKELRENISSTQNDIQKNIGLEQDKAKGETIDNLDTKVAEVKEHIKQNIYDRSQEIQGHIKEESEKIEEEAKVEMEDVIKNINK